MMALGDDWKALMAASRGAVICGAVDLAWPINPEGNDFAQQLALLDLGLSEARIYAEPRLKRNPSKADRDARLGRDTIHLAPTWRYADPDEPGIPALILPVGDDGRFYRTLSLKLLSDDDFADAIVDLIALPLDGSRALSLTGHTTAIGCFNVDGKSLRVQVGGLAWLKTHLARIGAVTAETPPHLVRRLHSNLPPPDDIVTLLIEPLALDWRVTSAGCVIPHAALEVVALDSLRLARTIDAAMREKMPCRSLPTVRGPKTVGAAAA